MPEQPVVLVLPVHDEAPTVVTVIRRVPPVTADGRPVQVVVVDDGSTDGSADLARAAGADVVAHGRNRGLGAAVRTGIEEARRRRAWAMAFLDADGEYDPAELDRLLEPLAAGRADYVAGNRFAAASDMTRWRWFGNHVLTLLTSALAGQRLGDAQSGFRALGPGALAVAEVAHDYNYAQVLTLDLLGRGLTYAEVPISYSRRREGRSFVRLGPYLRGVLPVMVRVRRRSRRRGDAPVDVLLVTGPAGVGKTTLLWELEHQLQAAGTAHVVLDADELDRAFPATPEQQEELCRRNLAAFWANAARAGRTRLVMAAVGVDLAVVLPWLHAAVPGARVRAVRLDAPDAVLAERVRRRELGSGADAQLERTLGQAAHFRAHPDDRPVVATTGRPVPEVAAEVLRGVGWVDG